MRAAVEGPTSATDFGNILSPKPAD